MSTFYRFFFFAAVCILAIHAISCSGTDSSKALENIDFKLTFDLVHEIDELPHPDQPFYIPEITAIRAYGESDFLVTDNWLKQILHLDRNGEVIQTIGREGRGPGEFTDLWTVIPLQEGKIGVSNLGDARTIIFDSDGKPVTHFDMQPDDPYITGKVYPLNNDRYIVANHRHRSSNNDCIFIELDHELRPQVPCFGSYDELNETDIRFLRFSGRNAPFGDMHFIEEDKFIFVRRSYDGTHYFFRRVDNDWVIEHTTSGYTEIPASVSDLPDTPLNRQNGYWVLLDPPDEPAMFVLIHNQSHGYEKFNDQYLLHFTVTEQKGERIPGVELLTSDGDFLGYQNLSELHDHFGFNTDTFRIRAYNDGRLMVGTQFALYIFEVTLSFND